MKLRDVKKGDFLTLKDIEMPKESQVWIRGEYDHASRMYSIINFADANRERFLKGDKEVFIGFTF